MREQVEVLEAHADFAANFVDLFQIVRQLDAIHKDLSSLMFFQTVDTTDHRGFAGT